MIWKIKSHCKIIFYNRKCLVLKKIGREVSSILSFYVNTFEKYNPKRYTIKRFPVNNGCLNLLSKALYRLSMHLFFQSYIFAHITHYQIIRFSLLFRRFKAVLATNSINGFVTQYNIR